MLFWRLGFMKDLLTGFLYFLNWRKFDECKFTIYEWIMKVAKVTFIMFFNYEQLTLLIAIL